MHINRNTEENWTVNLFMRFNGEFDSEFLSLSREHKSLVRSSKETENSNYRLFSAYVDYWSNREALGQVLMGL